MSRIVKALAVGATLALGGCSLAWKPVRYDAHVEEPDADIDAAPEPDADIDAFDLDAGADAPEPDAWVPPDGWAPENCDLMSGDEDRDHLSNCDDSDCFGAPQCCTAAGGGTSLDWDLTSSADRLLQGVPTFRTISGRLSVDFGSGSAIRRYSCAPLAQGGDMAVRWTHAASTTATLNLVLSPSPLRGPAGYLDELAVRVDATHHVYVTEGGSSITLEDPRDCAVRRPADGRVALAPDARIELDFVPGVFAGRPALLATIRASTPVEGCGGRFVLVRDHPILVEQLVRTAPGFGCDEAPGLWLALEGVDEAFSFEPTIDIGNDECAAPGAFAAGGTLDLSQFPGATSALAGGLGAPDLEGRSRQWFLAFDASEEDRSAERLAGISVRAALGSGATSPRSTNWPLAGPPSLLAPNSREPSYSFAGGTLVFAHADPRATLGYRIQLAQESLGTPGTFSVEEEILGLGDCASLREPTFVDWISDAPNRLFFRCDVGAASTLGLTGIPATGDRENDIIGSGVPMHDRVIAHDVVVVRRMDRLYWAVWVLAWRPGGGQEVHLFVADAGLMARPELVPYAGNPVITSADDALCGDHSDCSLTSLTVASFPDPLDAGRQRLRFLFARSRYEGGTIHDLVALEQPAPEGLRPPP